jgi:hypothetical protein
MLADLDRPTYVFIVVLNRNNIYTTKLEVTESNPTHSDPNST